MTGSEPPQPTASTPPTSSPLSTSSTLPPPALLTAAPVVPPVAPPGHATHRNDRPERGSINAWQRIWIVLAVMMFLPAIGNVHVTPVRTVLYVVAGLIVLAAMGVVELAMALWYRARRG